MPTTEKVVSSKDKLFVLTGNGLPPAGGSEALEALLKKKMDGGSAWAEYQRTHSPRLGWRALRNDGSWQCLWLTPPIVVVPPKPKLPLSSSFPLLAPSSRYCPNCGIYLPRLYSHETVETEDRGNISLHQCGCGQLIRHP